MFERKKTAISKKLIDINFSKALTPEQSTALTQLLRIKKQESLERGERFLELFSDVEHEVEYEGKSIFIKISGRIVEYKGDNKKKENLGRRYKVIDAFIDQGGEGAVLGSAITIQDPLDQDKEVILERKKSALKRVNFNQNKKTQFLQIKDLQHEAIMANTAEQIKTKKAPIFFKNHAYLVMADGGVDLSKVLLQYKTVSESLLLMIKTLRMYLTIREKDIVHHDFKPNNLLLNNADQNNTLLENQTVKAIDLSHAKFATQIYNEVIWGTHGYSPPELYDHLTTQKSDIFSIAATLIVIARKWFPKMSEIIEQDKNNENNRLTKKSKKALYTTSILKEQDLFAGAFVSEKNTSAIHEKDKQQIFKILFYMINPNILERLPARKIEDVILVFEGVWEKMKQPTYHHETLIEDGADTTEALGRLFDNDHSEYGESGDKYHPEVILNRMLRRQYQYRDFFSYKTSNKEVEKILKENEKLAFRHALLQLFKQNKLEKIKAIIGNQEDQSFSYLVEDLETCSADRSLELVYFIHICQVFESLDGESKVDFFCNYFNNKNQIEMIVKTLAVLAKLNEKALLFDTLTLFFADDFDAIDALYDQSADYSELISVITLYKKSNGKKEIEATEAIKEIEKTKVAEKTEATEVSEKSKLETTLIVVETKNLENQKPGDQQPGDQKPGDQQPGDQKQSFAIKDRPSDSPESRFLGIAKKRTLVANQRDTWFFTGDDQNIKTYSSLKDEKEKISFLKTLPPLTLHAVKKYFAQNGRNELTIINKVSASMPTNKPMKRY